MTSPVRNRRKEACLLCANLRERTAGMGNTGKCTVFPEKIPHKFYFATGKNNGCQHFTKK